MPKKRKTRKQKILSEQKRVTVHEVTPSTESHSVSTHDHHESTAVHGTTFSLPTNYTQTHKTPEKKSSETAAISTNDYGYLGNDLIRTALLSGAIVIAELLIRLVYIH
ncbi:MAG TPA: hypothetical protein VLF93_03055 [Candidatus Saccharimonadales bacterium]|nr:hypothetical protein [Candidatus Saccharimonadales bacterium]